MEKETTICDILCPKCGSIHTTIIGTDEIEFDPDGTGHYFADVACYDCNKSFRMCYKFKYEITEQWCRH